MDELVIERTVPAIKDLIVQAAELVWEAQAMEGGPAHSIEQCFGDDPCRECRRYDAWLYLIEALEIGGHGNDQAHTWKNRVDALKEQIYIAANVEQPAREGASDAGLERGSDGTTEVDLLNTTDAMVWAREFCRLVREGHDASDEGWLVGWFASAMTVGEWNGQRQAALSAQPEGEPR